VNIWLEKRIVGHDPISLPPPTPNSKGELGSAVQLGSNYIGLTKLTTLARAEEHQNIKVIIIINQRHEEEAEEQYKIILVTY
jgi:hypothetical protein